MLSDRFEQANRRMADIVGELMAETAGTPLEHTVKRLGASHLELLMSFKGDIDSLIDVSAQAAASASAAAAMLEAR